MRGSDYTATLMPRMCNTPPECRNRATEPSGRLERAWNRGDIRPHFVRGVDVRAARVLASRVLDGGRFDSCSPF
jgi:hypothetical protein